MGVRKNQNTLTDAEKLRFTNAAKKMKDASGSTSSTVRRREATEGSGSKY